MLVETLSVVTAIGTPVLGNTPVTLRNYTDTTKSVTVNMPNDQAKLLSVNLTVTVYLDSSLV